MRNAIPYKGEWLCKGSEAYDLHEAMTKAPDVRQGNQAAVKFKHHMADIDLKFRALHGLPPRERGP